MEDLKDLTDREKQLLCDINQLTSEKQQILDDKRKAEDEFGKIRAKFKDLYLQREFEILTSQDENKLLQTEIGDVRAAAVVAQSTAQEELDRMRQHYADEIRLLMLQMEETGDTTGHRIGGIHSRNDNEEQSVEDLENSMLKAQKDTEMLKDIIVPLETELAEVKLQCQQLMSENRRLRDSQVTDNRPQPTVDMLLNLDTEEELGEGVEEALEEDYSVYRDQIETLEDALVQLTNEYEGMKTKHLEFSDTHNLLVDECSQKTTELDELKRSVQTTEAKWNDLTTRYTDKVDTVTHSFKCLRQEYDNLQLDYDENKNTVFTHLDELEEYRSKLVEDFAKLRMKLNDERKTHEDAQALLTDSLESCRTQILRLERTSEELTTSREMNEKLQNDVVNVTDKLNESQRKSKDIILGIQKQLHTANSDNEQLSSRISRLDKELLESLSVRDELALQSSELQVHLQNQKDLIKNIKWEHEDDVPNCRGCDILFTMTKRKSHCRKCGRIFCAECCSKTVEYGENKRTYKTCEECHARHKADTPPEYHTIRSSTQKLKY